MIICSALYYTGSLEDPQSLVRDNRFYPGKAVQGFPVWWQYVRRHYPDVPVVLFCDTASPIPLYPLLEQLGEPWEDVEAPYKRGEQIDVTTGKESYAELLRHMRSLRERPRVLVKWLSQHSGKYFWPMQRNLVEGIIAAYSLNEDLFWLDNDAFLNTDIRPLVAGYDVGAPQIAHHQMTMDSVCTYISARRLHALDELGIDLPAFLTRMLNEGPTDTRMHTLQEGGLYKLFAYGRARSFGADIELTHLSCYSRFMAYLERNPLDTPEYQRLRYMLASLDRERLGGVDLTFHDMDWPANAHRKEAQ